MQFLASWKVYRNDNSMVENQWVRIWSTEILNKDKQSNNIVFLTSMSFMQVLLYIITQDTLYKDFYKKSKIKNKSWPSLID